MTVIVPHHKTREEAIRLVDSQSDQLFEIPGATAVQLTEPKKTWNGSTMDFVVTAKAGFISLPIGGNVVVDDSSVTISVELPALVSKFVNEDALRAGIESKARGILDA
jgi:hypothetical protein